MVRKILCVAEKPSISRAVANHLGNNVQTRNVAGVPWLKNYDFSFDFGSSWGRCSVTMTCVAGHVTQQDFDETHRNWHSCQPHELFEARIVSFHGDKQKIADNIERQARGCLALFIWTDCDREGEHIGTEIREIVYRSTREIQVKRARFSNTERLHVINAAKHPVDLDERQAQAVKARMELDLRIGACFTRMQTMQLKPMIEHLQEIKAISYGSCQFPTLGFVVDRYFRVKRFVPEPFWKIQVIHEREGIRVPFTWKRGHLFDRMLVTIIYERCLDAGTARVTNLITKPTSKWKPLPLTTVELQKCGSRFLRLDSSTVMKLAEDLYGRGLISYPRTETDQFPPDMDLRALVNTQQASDSWGAYATSLINGGYVSPRSGRNNDKAHPPIHPVAHCAPGGLRSDGERKVYEFVVRRFLACCSDDARGESTTVTLSYSSEIFTAFGLTVLARNFLEVYPYDRWESSKPLPRFTQHEEFVPTEAKMTDGKTTPPEFLTEPELIALMDANGIGTDATMAEHIAKIKDRSYVFTRPRSSSAGGGGVQEFIPSTLGVALISGYDALNLELGLGKPHLRRQMEAEMAAICAGTKTRAAVVAENLERFREVYVRTRQGMDVIKDAVRRYVLEGVSS